MAKMSLIRKKSAPPTREGGKELLISEEEKGHTGLTSGELRGIWKGRGGGKPKKKGGWTLSCNILPGRKRGPSGGGSNQWFRICGKGRGRKREQGELEGKKISLNTPP